MTTHALHECRSETCQVCRGGLAYCNVCRGAEASLPSECPGRPLTVPEEDKIVGGSLDFRADGWVWL